MVIVAQSVRALDCGSRGRGFEPRLSPQILFSRGCFIKNHSPESQNFISQKS